MADLFGQDGVPLEAQIREVERELAQRRHFYAKQVSAGRMTQKMSDQRLRDMGAVAATLKALKAQRENGL
jgi:hypothetical protein